MRYLPRYWSPTLITPDLARCECIRLVFTLISLLAFYLPPYRRTVFFFSLHEIRISFQPFQNRCTVFTPLSLFQRLAEPAVSSDETALTIHNPGQTFNSHSENLPLCYRPHSVPRSGSTVCTWLLHQFGPGLMNGSSFCSS